MNFSRTLLSDPIAYLAGNANPIVNNTMNFYLYKKNLSILKTKYIHIIQNLKGTKENMYLGKASSHSLFLRHFRYIKQKYVHSF